MQHLYRDFQVTCLEKKPADNHRALIETIPGKDGLLCLLSETIDTGVFDAGTSLRIVANYATGFDNIDLDEADRRGIAVTNTPDVLTETTADLTWALIMAVARRVPEGDRFVRRGKFRSWEPELMLGRDVHDKTLGIIGMGRIGQAVARRAQGFSMPVLYVDTRHLTFDEEEHVSARRVDLDTVVRQSDFLSLHLPLTSSTYHIIDESQLRKMKTHAFLINTGRGPLVDENALVRALKDSWIAGAGLDVFEDEPELAEGLAELPNVVLTPHIGSASYSTRVRMGMMAYKNLRSFLVEGKMPPNLVNPHAVTL
jgi:glyoxylate reductase